MNTVPRGLSGPPLDRPVFLPGAPIAPAPISTPAEIIAEAAAGRMVILVDDADRENEGDLVIPAVHADPAAINFMARQACGLVCVAITERQARRLALPPMTRVATSRFTTAFTVSVEAADGVTTGISAHDRARTVAALVAADAGPDDVVMPGHVFPIVARDGGVLVRPGHTEAAVDVARLAGLPPAGVICEIMNEDGSMARLPDLRLFAARHGLKLGTIADLVAFRRETGR